jgi:DNA polymerase-3 subunit gamma/tau
MSYQVLARKWRPKLFREMVGQEHVLKALINALDHDRLHHAYLFTGTRGVGKTTIARILAKCINCEKGVSSEPCGVCSSCLEIAEGRFIDLIEVDAASRTKVEDTRELLDNVQYSPTRGRYKVYLIDEVHMLSNHSFNALLKTLEEPPPHVKFLLATTDPQKLPATILSRCLQLHLKNMSPERIVGHLTHVLKEEMISSEDPALWLLARAAQGSMRDALSLTDQAIAYGSGKVVETDVQAMLGAVDRGAVYHIIAALAAHDGVALMQASAHAAELSPDYAGLLDEILSVLHRIAVAQTIPAAIDESYGDAVRVRELAASLTAEDVQLFYQFALQGRRDLPLAAEPRGAFEMTLLRMLAFQPLTAPTTNPPTEKNRPAQSAVEMSVEQHNVKKSERPEVIALRRDIASPQTITSAAASQTIQSIAPTVPQPQSVVDVKQVEIKPAPQLKIVEPSRPTADIVSIHSEPDRASSVAPIKAPIELPHPAVMNNERWCAHFSDFAFGGVSSAIAANCQWLQARDGVIELLLDENQSTLFNDQQRERIAQCFNGHWGEHWSVDINLGVVSAETPAKYRERCQVERLQQAEQAIADDPNVLALIDVFDARIEQGSIAPNS